MKWLIALTLFFSTSVFSQEKIPKVEASKGKVYETCENHFQTSTPYKITPTVNPITGDHMAEEADLIVAGCEPLSVRRFYNHLGVYEQRAGGWHYNPESFLVANFEWSNQDIFAAAGGANGSIALFKPSATAYTYTLDTSKGITHFTPSGQSHPLNTKVNYHKIGDRKNKKRFYWQGEVIDGSGSRRSFASTMHNWLHDSHVEQFIHEGQIYTAGISPNVWTPYQLPIHEERLPNGNIICYSYVKWKENKYYPRPVLLNTITAFNSDRSKVLGFVYFQYKQDKYGNVYGITAVGSDSRSTSMHTRGDSPILLNAVYTPDKPPISYAYHYTTLNTVAKPDGRVTTTEFNSDNKVRAQYAPVGPNGERHPIGRYIYHAHTTDVLDAEDNKTVYHFDANRLWAVVAYKNDQVSRQVYRIDRMKWDYSNGNLLCKTIEDKTNTPLHTTYYKYDANHNPIEETVGYGNQ